MRTKTKKYLWFLIVPAFFIAQALFYQNCSKMADPIVSNSSQSSSAGNDGGTPITGPMWNKGEAFIYQNLPSTMISQMVQTQLTQLGYSAYTGPKAVAITADGLGFVRRGASPLTQDDINLRTLQGCYAISGGEPCSLIAVADAWNVSRNDLNNSFTYTTAPVTAVDASSIPFLAPADIQSVVSGYNAAATPKALAISLDGAYFWVASTAAIPIADITEATRLVMERCEMAAGVIPCTVFAQNSTVVFNAAAINRTPVIDYARTQLATNIPGMPQSIYTKAITGDYLANGGATNGFIYITADGHGGYGYGAANSDSVALSNCSANASTAFPCFKYATNKTLAPLTPNLVSLKKYGSDLHCKVVPRATCAAHLALGCAAGGQYYVIQSGKVVLQTCP